MRKNGAKLTVFFEEPFWVGLYQRWSGPKLEVAKITFGAEPKDGEVYQFLLEHWKRLSFSPPVEQEIPDSLIQAVVESCGEYKVTKID